MPIVLRQNPALQSLLGTSSIYHNVWAILPGLREVVFNDSFPVAITVQRSLNKPRTSLTLKFKDRSENIRITHEITVPPVPGKLADTILGPGASLCSGHPDAHPTTSYFNGEWNHGRILIQILSRSSVQFFVVSSSSFEEQRHRVRPQCP